MRTDKPWYRSFWNFNTPPAAPAAGSTGAPPTPTPAPSSGSPAPSPAPAPAPSPSPAPGTSVAPAPSPAPSPTPPAIDSSKWFTDAPENWRDSFVSALPEADREAGKNMFGRVSSLSTFATNYVNSQRQISKGLPPEDIAWLPKNPTPEQIAEYRTKMDVPATADKYQFALDQGLVLSDDDKKFFAPVFATMHAANMPNTVASQLVNEYLKLDQAQLAQQKVQDDHDVQECQLALKKTWGVDYARNMGLVEMFLQDLPKEDREVFTGARGADGKALFNNPAVLQFLLGKQREVNPLATVVSAAGSDGVKAMDTEIKALEAEMATDAWYKDTAKQARYRDLVTAREQLQQRGR